MSELHEYRVGAPYHPGRSSWPETVQYNYRQGAHELAAFLASPSPAEVDAFRSGPIDMALLVEGPALFLLYQIGHAPLRREPRPCIPWSDAPYSWHLVPQDQRSLPDPEPMGQEQALLSVFLVDAATGILRAVRVVSISHDFCAALHTAIRDQAGQEWPGSAAYDAAIRATYGRYPSSTAMVRAASSRCRAGT